MTEYDKKFKELSMFAPYMISNEFTMNQRFLAKPNEDIVLCILDATHLTHQLAREVALKVNN